MPTATIAPAPKHQFFTDAGAVAASYKLFTYLAGTTTKEATYTDSALSSANTNPIVLDSAGRATIFLSATSYKFVLAPSTDTDPPASPVWTVDNVGAVPPTSVDVDVSATAGEALSANDCVYLSDGSGSLTAGRWYKADADNTYSSTAPMVGFATAAIASAATGTVRIIGRMTGFSSLSTGSTYYASATAGSITATQPANPRVVGVADSSTSLVLAPNPRNISPTVDIEGTAGEALTAGDSVYLSDGSGGNTAGRFYKTDADNTYSSTQARVLGFAPAAISSGATGSIRISGRVTGLSSLTAGTTYYASATAGALTSTAPTNARAVGVADSTTSIVISNWVVYFAQSPTSVVGGGTATARMGGVVSWNGTAAANTGGAETDLMSYSLPAATLDGVNAYAVRVTFTGTLGAAAETKRMRLKFGATTVLDLTSAASATTTRFSGQATITRLSATTQGAAGWIQERDGGLPTSDWDSANPGETLANAITIKVTGLATTSSSITQTSMLVEVL